MCDWALPATVLPLLLLLLLLGVGAPPAVEASSKYACDYSNRLCQWTARYMFGASVMGDKVFFNGGILSNDANMPVNGSAFEVLDLRTLSPYVVQVEDNASLTTSRYRHQLVSWQDKILAVGGQHDDSYGMSQQVINVIALDLNTRQWSLLKQFKSNAQAEIIFEASLVVGDALLIVFQNLKEVARMFAVLDLNTKKVDYNYYLSKEDINEFLDYPVVSVVTLGTNGNFPHLVVAARRQLPNAQLECIKWYEVTAVGLTGVEGPLSTTVSTGRLKELPGGSGGKVLSFSILSAHDTPKLVIWALTDASFGSKGSRQVNVVSVYDIDVSGVTNKRLIALRLSNLLMTQPLGVQNLSGLQSVDLPFHGDVQATPADVTVMPYIGIVDLVGALDTNNVNIQPWSGKGFIVRGAAIADYDCQPAATWQPFVVMVDMPPAAAPIVTAVSNYTWCATRRIQLVAAKVVGDGAALESNTKLYRVDSNDGPHRAHLMLLNAQRKTNPGGQLDLLDDKKPLQGAYINVGRGSVDNFTVAPSEGYPYPVGVASCMTTIGNQAMYIQLGGHFFSQPMQRDKAYAGFVAVAALPCKPVHNMVAVSGAAGVRETTFASMACSPDGQVYVFGGLAISNYEEVPYGDTDITIAMPVWAPTAALFSLQLGGSSKKPSLSKATRLAVAKGAAAPGPRSGHAMAFLPHSTVSLLGMQAGALFLYGGSDVDMPSLSELLKNEAEAAAKLRTTEWDTTAWLFNVASGQWVRLAPVGDLPPGLMYHSIAVEGRQVMLFGGLQYNKMANNVRRSTYLYVLDFSERTTRWRRAAVDNINTQGAFQLAFPNTGIAALPESGAVALMHKSGISLTAIPQSIQAPSTDVFADWGLNWGLNMTAGDWIRLPPASSAKVKQPLLLAGDIIITGGEGGSEAAGRSLLQEQAAGGATPGLLELRCSDNATSAVAIRSSGAVLENVRISGCKGSAVTVTVDATGAYTIPAVLHNVHITANNGSHGAAVSVGPYASVIIQSSTISSNKATDSVVHAQAGSALQLIDTTVAGNNGTGVAFRGSNLTVLNSTLVNNTASQNGGALSVACPTVSAGVDIMGCNSQARIHNTRFEGNRALAKGFGGALYMQDSTFAALHNVTFVRNRAWQGGAVLAEKDACLFNMTLVTFDNNTAGDSGGALLMRGPSCLESITWQQARFTNNSAGRDGGAMYLGEMAQRKLVGQGHYEDNSAGNDGGAVYIGMWSSRAQIYKSSFTSNSASRRGGAVCCLAIESSISLNDTTATNNHAGQLQQLHHGWPMQQSAGGVCGAASEGGAVRVGGSEAKLWLANVSMDSNTATKGGAVALSSEGGQISIDGSSFTANRAISIGGAVAVTERKSAIITSSNFTSNELLLRGEQRCLAAGGGFYCLMCDAVAIKASQFVGNKACYGGGAAVLQAGDSSTNNSLFEGNAAVPVDARQRVMLQQSKLQLSTGSKGCQQAALDILGALDANTTADSGFYTGGGGLYLSVAGRAILSGCVFKRNEAYNGGGVLARTDNCKRLGTDSGCRLVLHNSSIPADNYATGGGDGLLVTNISASIVQLQGCSVGSSLNLDTSKACLQPSSAPAGVPSSSRGLLQANGGSSNEPGGSQLPSQLSSTGAASVATAAGLDYLATSAAELRCFSLATPNTSSETLESCSSSLLAGPGIPFNPGFFVVDGLGRNVTAGIYDAQMPMQAQLLHDGNGSLANFVMESNSTRAIAGRAVFAGLRVRAAPGTRYTLRFTTQSGIVVDRGLVLRHCWAGEATARRLQGDAQWVSCVPCEAPSFSLYPSAPNCSLCMSLLGAAEVCNGAAVVPASGFYQSHPRSPLLHGCVNPKACHRNASMVQAMSDWAYNHRGYTIAQLNNATGLNGTPLVDGYMRYMCEDGYEGPLCGACKASYGHTAHNCTECLPRIWNNILYIGLCVFMFLVPALNMWLHSQNVRKRSAQIQQAGMQQAVSQAAAELLCLESLKPTPSARQPPAEAAAGSISSSHHLQLVVLQQHHQQQAGANSGADVTAAAHSDQDIAHSVSSPMPNGKPAAVSTSGIHTAAGMIFSGLQPPTATTVSPFIEDRTPLTRLPNQRPGRLAAAAPPAQMHAAASASSMGRRSLGSSRIFRSFFDHELLDDSDIHSMFSISTIHSPSSHGSLALQQPQQQQHVPPSTQRSMSMPVRRASECQQGSSMMGAGSAVQLPPGMPQRVRRRAFKFWHTDIIMMLVNYMQLLGLLRLIRLNWPQQLHNILVFMDFTSSSSTWISLECSFNSQGLPRSVKRAIVMLLWPVAALAVLSMYWAVYAYVLSRRCTPGQFRATFKRCQPHIRMSWVVMAFFLYTPTSREVISLFSCQKVDAAGQLPPQAAYAADAKDALTLADNKWGVWTSDTNVVCGSRHHLGLLIGGGVPGLLWVFGLPLSLWLALRRWNRVEDMQLLLESEKIELQYGLMYDKYRYARCYWECWLLFENFSLTMLLVMLQSQPPALQVLCAMAVIFIEAVLHLTFQPYACRMLDTLRRMSVFGLMVTLFLIMLMSLSQFEHQQHVDTAAMAAIIAINFFVVSLYLSAAFKELCRWLTPILDRDNKGYVSWQDLKVAPLQAVQAAVARLRRSRQFAARSL